MSAMDDVEEAGLRAFTLHVESSGDPGHPDRPLAIERDGFRAEVVSVRASWIEEERIGFRVRLSDGAECLLYYVPELDLWSGVWLPDGAESSTIRRRH